MCSTSIQRRMEASYFDTPMKREGLARLPTVAVLQPTTNARVTFTRHMVTTLPRNMYAGMCTAGMAPMGIRSWRLGHTVCPRGLVQASRSNYVGTIVPPVRWRLLKTLRLDRRYASLGIIGAADKKAQEKLNTGSGGNTLELEERLALILSHPRPQHTRPGHDIIHAHGRGPLRNDALQSTFISGSEWTSIPFRHSCAVGGLLY